MGSFEKGYIGKCSNETTTLNEIDVKSDHSHFGNFLLWTMLPYLPLYV